jgi:hypothetical protein
VHLAHWIRERRQPLSVLAMTVVAQAMWLLATTIPYRNWQELFDRLYGFLD